jgi:hypothetical protein
MCHDTYSMHWILLFFFVLTVLCLASTRYSLIRREHIGRGAYIYIMLMLVYVVVLVLHSCTFCALYFFVLGTKKNKEYITRLFEGELKWNFHIKYLNVNRTDSLF